MLYSLQFSCDGCSSGRMTAHRIDYLSKDHFLLNRNLLFYFYFRRDGRLFFFFILTGAMIRNGLIGGVSRDLSIGKAEFARSQRVKACLPAQEKSLEAAV